MQRLRTLHTLTLLFACVVLGASPGAQELWPTTSREARPWTRWWWLGSAVDETNLTRQLTLFRDAGLGGVEICPIYGIKGLEQRHVEFLSPRWMQLLAHTTSEAARLGLGVDMTTGTGWPFGGPWITPGFASGKAVLKDFAVKGGTPWKAKLPAGTVQCVVAVGPDGKRDDLTGGVHDGVIEWTPTAGDWRVYAILFSSPVQKVKRAAPGGEGSVVDPFSVDALNAYLAPFDRAFAGFRAPAPRSQFHDSFEYYGATWTPRLLEEFHSRRGYDLRAHLPALFGQGDPDTIARVKCDFRETMSDLHLAYLHRWNAWAHTRGSWTRNQAHGSPGNLVDLYAAPDVPETETFGSFDEKHVPMLKFASSAAHLKGSNLVSAESFTWLDEHFHASLNEVKQAADYLFLVGVNHLFFHGIPYSPADAPWPGWQFYAAVNFGPQGGLWRDLPAFNDYVTRVQSILQNGRADSDVLLYFPMHDLFQKPSELLIPLTVHNVEKVLAPHPFHAAAMTLWERGFTFDHISDRFLAQARSDGTNIIVGTTTYRALVLPRVRVMPEATLRHVAELARAGAKIVIQDRVPEVVPGLARLDSRRDLFQAAARELSAASGRVRITNQIDTALASFGVAREPCVDQGLRFVRRTTAQGHDYFIANRSTTAVSGWIALGTEAASALVLDPRFADRAGQAALRKNASGAVEIRLALDAGESCVVRTSREANAGFKAWPYWRAGAGVPIAGEWKVQFIEGGPALPASFATRQLASWTERDAEANRFAGTARYTIEFDLPSQHADDWVLDLGRVAASARVTVNGRPVATLWCAPFRVAVGSFLRAGKNRLDVEVTNLAANRVADLDRRRVEWKYFYDINMASKHYRQLDASQWPPMDSGLLGPVQLVPQTAAR